MSTASPEEVVTELITLTTQGKLKWRVSGSEASTSVEGVTFYLDSETKTINLFISGAKLTIPSSEDTTTLVEMIFDPVEARLTTRALEVLRGVGR